MSDTDMRAARLEELERRLAAFKRDHGASSTKSIATYEARLAALRAKLEAELANGHGMSALGHEFERDMTGLAEDIAIFIIEGGQA